MEIPLSLNPVLGIRGVHLDRGRLSKSTVHLLCNVRARNICRRRAIRVVLNVRQRGIHKRIVHARNLASRSHISAHKGSALKSLTHRGCLRKHTIQHNCDHRHQRNGGQLIGLAGGRQEHDTELNRETEHRVQCLSHTHVRQGNKVLPVGGCEQPRRILKPEHFVHLLVESPEFFSRTFF